MSPVRANKPTFDVLYISTFFNDKVRSPSLLSISIPTIEFLIVEPGARIHFHRDSGILVANTASMKSIGLASSDSESMENQIIFEGDRLEPSFADVPGQWGTIWLTAGSTNHEFSFTTIKNSIVGILMDSNDGDRTLTLKNVE